MSAEAATLSRSWKVGRRTVTLSMPRPAAGRATHAVIEWDPEVPQRLSRAELQQYRAGRNAAVAAVSRELGITAAVVEV